MRHSGSKCVAEAPPSLSGLLPVIPGTSIDFTRLCEGNDPPCDSEIPFIRDIISEALTRVDVLDAQIRDSGEIPTRLVEERAEAMERVRKHRGILSPVRRMPPELVCGIFALLLEDDTEILPKPLWRLGHICRSWRLFVLGDTQFWSCITIPTAPLRPGDCAMIETQLLRSANAPLKVYWVSNDNGHTMDPRMAGVVVAECSRWTSLRLGVRSSEALDWLRSVNGRLASLQKLEVFHGYNVVVPDVFSIAPNLRKVNLGQWPLDLQEASPKISIPWGQITHYRGTHTGKSQLSIVRAAPSLVQCILGFEDSLFPAHSSITLPHLRGLYISDAHILEYLSTPVLEDLFYTDLPTTHTSRLLSFVRGSQCSRVLRTLVLMDCCIDPDLITVLRDLPNLALLFIETSSQEQGQPAFFDAMTISGAFLDNACPNVTSLSYGVTRDFPYDRFFAMVQSRIAPPNSRFTRLRVFDVNGYLESDQMSGPTGIDSWIQRLREEGLDAVFLGEDDVDGLAAEASFHVDRLLRS